MPLHMRMPKRGFSKRKSKYQQIPLEKVVEAIDAGAIDPSIRIDEDHLRRAGLLNGSRLLAKIIGNCQIERRLNIYVAKASRGAVEKITGAGGRITVYNGNIMVRYLNTVFENYMKYEVMTLDEGNKSTLSIIFSFSSGDLATPDIDKLDMIVDSREYGIDAELIHPGRDAKRADVRSLEYRFNFGHDHVEAASVDLMLMYRKHPVDQQHVRVVPGAGASPRLEAASQAIIVPGPMKG